MASVPLPTGSRPVYIMNAPIVERWDYDGNSNMIYHGVALPCSATSAAVWFIEKYTYDGSNRATLHQLADGNDLCDNIWDDRASLSYS